EEQDQIERAVILGRPGEGKTTLTQLTCRQIAERSLQLWTERETPLAEMPFPLWLTVKDVLTAGSIEAAIEGAIPIAVASAVEHARRKAEKADLRAAGYVS